MCPLQTSKQGCHASWKVLGCPQFFSWKFQELESTLVLESPGNWRLRSWKVLEKYPWKLRTFINSNEKTNRNSNMSQFVLTFTFTYFWKQLQSTFYFMLQFRQWTILRMLCGVFSLYLSIPGLWKGPGKFLTGFLESPGKVTDFFQWMSGNPGFSKYLSLLLFNVIVSLVWVHLIADSV